MRIPVKSAYVSFSFVLAMANWKLGDKDDARSLLRDALSTRNADQKAMDLWKAEANSLIDATSR